jgi:hypothetical protein
MKRKKIMAALLVLIGFGSCAPRASKSKAPAEQPTPEVTVDSLVDIPIMVMYGPPSPRFEPNRPIKSNSVEQPTESNSTPPEAE